MKVFIDLFPARTFRCVCQAQLNPFSIQTINPGDSVLIYYDVTINANCNCNQISNQGTLSGSNFTSIQTDDPDTAPLSDATITSLNVYPLPVTIFQFRAFEANRQIRLEWKVTEQVNVSHYEIEKSADGINFTTIGSVAALHLTGDISYAFADVNPYAGSNFYRIRSVDNDGKFKYTRVIRINPGHSLSSFTIAPNPVYNRLVSIQLVNLNPGKYDLIVVNSLGQVLMKGSIDHSGGSRSEDIVLPSAVKAGVYSITIRGASSMKSQLFVVR
jgi:hypothetical protein